MNHSGSIKRDTQEGRVLNALKKEWLSMREIQYRYCNSGRQSVG
jgi:hypothetical protein